MSKQCTKCETDKLASQFSKSSSSPDGLSYHCKACHKEAYELQKEAKPFYSVWQNVKQRCNNKKRYEYKFWGGKGIKNMLGDDYATFESNVKKAYGLARRKYGKKVELCIDRIDCNGHYEVSNIRFITRLESNMNRVMSGKHTTKLIELNGHEFTINEISNKYDLPSWLIRRRLDSGWSVERAINERVNTKGE